MTIATSIQVDPSSILIALDNLGVNLKREIGIINRRVARKTRSLIAKEVTKERMERLRHVIERSATAKNAARVGRIEEVVVEGPSKRNPGVITGRTRQNKLLHFSGDLKAGSLANVEVTEAKAHYLLGELREVLRGPLVRTKIPVIAG